MPFTVLVKTWVNTSVDPDKPSENTYEEDLFEASRVVFNPAGCLDDEYPMLALEGCSVSNTIALTANRTVYVMNSTGKTVASYQGTMPLSFKQ